MNDPSPLRFVIVGGVAADASAAARARLSELDRNRPVVTVCALGKTAYFAARILAQNGFTAMCLTGGIRAHFAPRSPAKLPTP
jgi:rhodanese-related sulfurtransferase